MNDQNIIHIGAKKPIKDNQMIENEPNFNKNYKYAKFFYNLFFVLLFPVSLVVDQEN